MTKEHIGISLAMEIPMFVVFTKIDIAPEIIYKENFEKMKKILKTLCNKVPVNITKFEDVESIIDPISTGKVTPIFSVSSCTGEGIDILRKFMSILPAPQVAKVEEEKISQPIYNADSQIQHQFVVDSCY